MSSRSPAARVARRLDARGIHYGWVIAAVAFLTLITAAGFRSTVGVLIVPLQDEFGWSRATISAAVAINLVLYGLGGPFAAGLYDRFGIRRVIVIALATIAISSTLTTQIDAPWQLDLLWGVANGLATGAIGVTLAAVIASRWFVERRGVVTGMLTASNATGQLVFLPLLGWIVTAQGWRSAALTVSIVALAFTLPLVALFLRDSPAEIGLRAYGAVEDDPVILRQNPFRAAIGGLVTASRTSTFWLLTGSFFICGATTNGLIGTHLIPAAMDHGMSEVAAASLLAVIGVFDLVGTLCSGWLTDRYDPRWLLFWYYGLRGLSLLVLPFVIGSSNLGLIAFVVFYGLDWVATVPPTVAITAKAFGREHVGVVFGWIFGAHQLGAAVAAWGAGAARTWFGDYQSAFITAGLISLLAAGLVIRITPAPCGCRAGRAQPGRSARMKRRARLRPRRRRARGRARRSRRRAPAARRDGTGRRRAARPGTAHRRDQVDGALGAGRRRDLGHRSRRPRGRPRPGRSSARRASRARSTRGSRAPTSSSGSPSAPTPIPRAARSSSASASRRTPSSPVRPAPAAASRCSGAGSRCSDSRSASACRSPRSSPAG